MVAKINTGSSLFGALAYNQNKIDEEQGKVLFSNKMFESEDGSFNVLKCIKCFEMHLPKEIKTEKPIIHISLNPHPDDVLSDDQLADIAQEYMQKLGYGNQPYIVYKHEDINRHHIHIVSLRVDENGKKVNDSFEYKRSKDITRELEEKYNLHKAEKNKQKEQYQFSKVDYTAGNVKKQIANTVRGIINTYQFQSFNELKTILSLYNIHAEEVKGMVCEKPYTGTVYSATNNTGKKQGNPIKSSRISKSVGFEAIQRRVRQHTKSWKEDNTLKNSLRAVIEDSIKKSISKELLRKNLRSKGIEVIFRQNEAGRIYGVTFIDYENKIVFNGSRLGKDFSANIFNDLYNISHTDKENIEHDTLDTSQDGLFSPTVEQSEYESEQTDNFFSTEENNPSDLEHGYTEKPDEENAISSGRLINIIPNSKHNVDEPLFPFKKKKKKRKRNINNQ